MVTKNLLAQIHSRLGITKCYASDTKLPLCWEAEQLVATELDFYKRPQRLTAEAFFAWSTMKLAASDAGQSIFLISAFRSIDYQQQLIQKKLDKGVDIESILEVNAAPGYSEHHSGRAIDIGTLGCDALIEAFDQTRLFAWLTVNAHAFNFYLSYPKNNPSGICYEPWHWCFKEKK